ncbi:hypothetical protein SporoP37_01710 [Sporosarcina sp. P37]|uniref:post-transcriptional regulator n=1 Tax=unclassified Sporosarcina TaxID=2647733 RepID=UPI0009C00183|nr:MULTISPECIES: post-transcriptional regulator [unclassified Sporosarcina]ARD47011.1 hypothetical protein SporoP33_01305 [Sporosarcina sp. P33]ARK23534.1 hypothetical protein SporoP37_01710 [Sporosarcina sp. P37]PID18844.1 hypothetical protein CSV62_07040 [Sporosarcina sp. P35]
MDQQLKEIYRQLLPALESKKNELTFYGYSEITEEDLLLYLAEKKWRKKDISAMHPYKMTADILAITAAQFMTHTQTEAQRRSEEILELSKEEWAELFSPKKSE